MYLLFARIHSNTSLKTVRKDAFLCENKFHFPEMLLGGFFCINGMWSFQLVDCMQTGHFKWVVFIVLRSLITLLLILRGCMHEKQAF